MLQRDGAGTKSHQNHLPRVCGDVEQLQLTEVACSDDLDFVPFGRVEIANRLVAEYAVKDKRVGPGAAIAIVIARSEMCRVIAATTVKRTIPGVVEEGVA